MMLGAWKKQRPWRWLLLVWIGVPLVMAYYHFVVRWPHSRGQIYAAFFQLLAASAGANGGHYMRDMIDHVFLKQDDRFQGCSTGLKCVGAAFNTTTN